jgi:plastocyanin
MRLVIFGSFIVALAAAGCGSDSSNSSGTTSNPTAPTGSTTTPTTTPASPATDTTNILGVLGANSFSPNPIAANQGDLLVWHNTDSITHHIVLGDGSLDAGNILPGASSPPMRFADTTATYHCEIHPSMVGSINAATQSTPTPPTTYSAKDRKP